MYKFKRYNRFLFSKWVWIHFIKILKEEAMVYDKTQGIPQKITNWVKVGHKKQ